MIEAYHIYTLAVFGFLASIWKGEGWFNIFIKLALTGAAVWGAVIVAKDWFA